MSVRLCLRVGIAGLVLANVVAWLGGTVALAYDGDLVSSFGSGGVLGIAMGTWDGWGRRGAVQSDGNFLIAGTAERTSDDVGVTRVTPIGSLDNFGSGGRVYWDLSLIHI